VVISAGFSELGEEGERLQREITETTRSAGIPLVGPNGQGVSCPSRNAHPWMPAFFPKPGKVAIISQSGNLLTWLAEGLEIFGCGISKAVSAGNMADLDWADYLWYFADDPETKVILLYIEGIKDGQRKRI
jgi:acetyltransferase